jgi:hypothetical protein
MFVILPLPESMTLKSNIVFNEATKFENQDDRMGSNTLKRYTLGRHEQKNILKAPTVRQPAAQQLSH